MNKEQFRKELEDAFDAGYKRREDGGTEPNVYAYIDDRLAALDDGDGEYNEEQLAIEIDHILESGPNLIRLLDLFKRFYKPKPLDDGQEGRGLVRYTQKEVIDLLKYIREYDDFYNLVDEDLLETFVPSYTEIVLNRPALPVADGEGEVDWKSKYEKCINIIKRFDAGIIGMYDL